MKKTIDYVTSEKEESTLRLLCEKLSISYIDVFNDVNKFFELEKHYMTHNPEFQKIKGWSTTKYKCLHDLHQRIKAQDNSQEITYFPDIKYSLAKNRYESLKTRNFERIIFEAFHEKIFSNFLRNWDKTFSKESFHSELNNIKPFLTKPDLTWLEYSFPLNTQTEIESIYKEMQVVRFRNYLFSEWKNIFSNELDVLKDLYDDSFFPLHSFIKFYGPNTHAQRECEYCHITEETISILASSQEIKTKRFYSRGATMEVDKRDPQRGYEINNLVMSCYWCNNAKTDEFSDLEFESIGKAISLTWKARLMRIQNLSSKKVS